MNLLTCILTENACYKANRTITPKGVMVHSTGADNPNIKRYVQPVDSTPGRDELLAELGVNANANDWNHTAREACVHAFIGKLADGSVAACQTLPWNWRGWHAGTGTSGQSANNTHISFEICEDGLTDSDYFSRVYREAVELTAYLCKQYALDPLEDGVVICHQEGYRRGVASNHGDVLHWFPKMGRTMDDFRADVAAALTPKPKEEDDMRYYEKLNDVPGFYRPTIQKLMERGALSGYSDPDPDPNSLEDNIINVSEDFCRILTLLDLMGKLD